MQDITTYLITTLKRHEHTLSILRHLRYQWPWISLRGHPRLLIFAPIESAYITSYWTSVITLVLSCRVSEILELLYAESSIFDTAPLFRPKFQGVPLGVDPWCSGLQRAETIHMLWSWNREIISKIGLDWIVQCFTSPPTQYRLYGRRFLQVRRPNQQYRSTEGKSTKDKSNNGNNTKQTCIDNNRDE